MEVGTSLGIYRVVAHLGAGGMGEVYRARDTELERDVALKILPPVLAEDISAMARFRREAQLLASVNHPNIATIHAIGEEYGVSYLVLELLEGYTLADRLQIGPLPPPDAFDVCRQIARALEAAHNRGVIHRDLKPANVMISPEGWVKVLDFGLAKALETGEPGDASLSEADSLVATETLGVTLTGTRLGTVPYMSPEQVRGQKVDQRTDVWAFGCVVFETLTGRRPFKNDTAIETLSAILEREPPWKLLPAEVPSAVRRMLVRCLKKDADQRIPSMSDVRAVLEDTGEGSPGTPRPIVPRRKSGPAEASASALGMSPSTLDYLDTLDHYTVVERLAVGGQGELYRAWDRERERDVALKVLRPELVSDTTACEQLRHEARTLRALSHPNIAAFYDAGSVDGIEFLVTEYVPGTSLAARLEEGVLPAPVIADLGAQVADALAEAHDRGILHRDLKTSNVLVTRDGQAKLIDFGLASTAEDTDDARRVDPPLVYRAPEVLRGAEPDRRSDLYSLGVVLYKMATGAWPFQGHDEEALAAAILGSTPAPPAVPPALRAIILRCLEKDPERRFQSARELAGELRALSLTRPPVAPARGPRRWRTVFAAAAGVAAVVASLLWWRLAPDGEGEETPLAAVDSMVVMPSRLINAEGVPYLGDAIPNTISTYLSQVDGVLTKLPPSSLDLERLGGDLGRLAEVYDVEAMVLSTVNVEGDRLVLNLQLVDTATRDLLWSREYQGDRAAYLALARRAAEGIREALRPGSRSVQASPETPASSEAEMLVQQGRYYANLYRNLGREGDRERAIAAFERAVEMDPARADAAAEIAVVHAASLDLGRPVLEVLPEVERWAERALAADPKNSKAWAVLGYVEGGRQPESYRRKLEYLLKAATYDPMDGYAHSRLSNPLTPAASLALASSHRASEVDPLMLISPLFEALFLTLLERIDEALARIDQVLAIEPDMPFALLSQAMVLSVGSREREALELVETALDPLVAEGKLHPSWVEMPRQFASFALASENGDTAAADAAAGRLVALGRGEPPFPRWQAITIGNAIQLARFGRPDDAIEVLRSREEQGVVFPYDLVLWSKPLEPLADDPRLAEVRESSRRQFETMVAILDEANSRGEMPPYLAEPLSELLQRLRHTPQDG